MAPKLILALFLCALVCTTSARELQARKEGSFKDEKAFFVPGLGFGGVVGGGGGLGGGVGVGVGVGAGGGSGADNYYDDGCGECVDEGSGGWIGEGSGGVGGIGGGIP